jgi:MFS family permease
VSNARWRGIAAAIACISIVGVGMSLTIPLLSFELERRNVSGVIIGLQTATSALASIMFSFVVPRLMAQIGPRRLLVAAILVGAATILAFPITINVWAWFPLRFILGAALATLFIVSEYWITAVAEESRRGFVMGVYATFLSVGFAAGPGVLAVFGSVGWLPYLIGATILIAGLGPVIFGGGAVPDRGHHREAVPVLSIVAIAPTAVLAAFFFGAIESANFSFLALWGQRAGFTEQDAALLLTATFLGNVALQIPLGYLADRMDKRIILLGCGLMTMVGALAAPSATAYPFVLFAGLFFWGGIVGGLYTVGLAHLAARFHGPQLAAANAAFVMNYSFGMLLGPPVAGLGLEHWNPHGFMLVLAAFSGAYGLLVAHRIIKRA